MGNIEKDLELLKHSEEIQVVIVEPMKRPYRKIIKNDLNVFNDIVDGYMRPLFIDNINGIKIAIALNEDGLLIDLPLNRRIVGFENPIVGTFFITAYSVEGNISLPNFLVDIYLKQFSTLEVYL
jgi:hypothetical protein